MSLPGTLEQYVIYDHPDDYPAHVVVRRWFVSSAGLQADRDVYLFDDLIAAREFIFREAPELVCLHRQAGDDPAVAEVWT